MRTQTHRGSAPGVTPAPETWNNLEMNEKMNLLSPLKKSKVLEEVLSGNKLKELLEQELFVQELEGNPIGSLKRHIQAWKDLGCAPQIIQWIQHGTPLFFERSPESGGGRANYVPLAAMRFANEEITRLLVVRAIEEDDGVGPGYVFPVGAVPKPHELGKWRLITDLTDGGRGPNSAMPDKPFRMEQVDDLLCQIGKNWWGLTFDLRAGFHHLEVDPDYRRWLRFMWAGKLYHFNAMPFGPRHSPFIFNKVVREFVLILRRGCTVEGCNHQKCRFCASPHGVVVAPFVDDFCIAAPSKEMLLRIRDEIVVPLMEEMGWIRALGKGCWEPAQVFDFLGLTIDTVEGKVFIPEKKLARYLANLESLLSKEHITVRELASVAGKVVSVMRAFAPALMSLRSTFALIAKYTDGKIGWNSHIVINEEVRSDLLWLKSHLRTCNGRFAWRPARVAILQTDASGSIGWGATLRLNGKLYKAQGRWSEQDKEAPIHILEMKAILLGVQSFRDRIRGQRVQFITDSTICKHTLPVGSRLPDLRDLVKRIQHLVMALDATLVDVTWIPSELNEIPDDLSRWVDANDWVVTDQTWVKILSRWPNLGIDRFSSGPQNSRLPKFNTRFASPECQEYNCMAQDWSQEGLSYACPPMAMVGAVLQLVAQQKAEAVIVVPHWPQQPWWPKLRRMALESFYLGKGTDAFQPGPSGQCAPHKNPSWEFLAVRVKGRGN